MVLPSLIINMQINSLESQPYSIVAGRPGRTCRLPCGLAALMTIAAWVTYQSVYIYPDYEIGGLQFVS